MNPMSFKSHTSDLPIIQQGAEPNEENSLKRRKTERGCGEIVAVSILNSEVEGENVKGREVGILGRKREKKLEVAIPEKQVNVRDGMVTTFFYNSQGLEEETVSRLPAMQSCDADDDWIARPLPLGGVLVRTTSVYKEQTAPPSILVKAKTLSPQKKPAKQGDPRKIKRGAERIRPYRQSMKVLRERLIDLTRSNPVLRRMWTPFFLPNPKLTQVIGNAIETLVDQLRDPSTIGREEFSELLMVVKQALIKQNSEENLTEEEMLYGQGHTKMPKDYILNERREYFFELLTADQLSAFIGLMDQFFDDPTSLAHMEAITKGKIIG